MPEVALTTNRVRTLSPHGLALVVIRCVEERNRKLATIVTPTETKVTARQKRDFYQRFTATYKRVVNDLSKGRENE